MTRKRFACRIKIYFEKRTKRSPKSIQCDKLTAEIESNYKTQLNMKNVTTEVSKKYKNKGVKMDQSKDLFMESLIFHYIDELRFLFFPDETSQFFMDYSKNEIFTLLLIDQRKMVNVTEVAEYIHAPLNTATGIINRLEKKLLVKRERDDRDKRVVKICLTEKGKEFVTHQKSIIIGYLKKIAEVLSEEEKRIALEMISKIIKVLKTRPDYKKQEPKKVRKIVIE